MKCLITGGAGFIGSHLCDEFISTGHEVVCVDNLITGNKRNISHLLDNPLFSFIEHDCSQPLRLKTTVDLILHFASPASPSKYQEFPLETILVNSIGTVHLAEMARRANARIVFASTSEIYGDPLEHPQHETYWGNVNPIGGRSCYDESKRLGETILMTYVRKYGIDGRIIRIFNTYGPRMDIQDGRVVTNFIQQIIDNAPITINGDGSQTRSFCYITDLIKGICLVAQKNNLKGEVFNLGNDTEITILDLAKKLITLTKYQGSLNYTTLPQDDPARRKPDISKIKKHVGWMPHVSLEIGLLKTFHYFQSLKA